MGCASGCGRAFLAIVNIILLLLGAVLLAGGLVLKFGRDVINQAFNLNDIAANIPSLSSYGSGDTSGTTSATPAVDVNGILDSISIPLIISGTLLFVISLTGCIGGCCRVKCMLVLYAIIVLIIFLALIILVPMFFTHKLDSAIKEHLNSTIANNYKGLDDFTMNSLPWNLAMLGLGCCGVDNYLDFNAATNWNRVYVYTTTVNGHTYKYTYTEVAPFACCKMSGAFPDMTPKNTNCSFTPTTEISNYMAGCFDTAWQKADSYFNIIIGISSAIIVLLALCFIIAVILAASGKNKVDSEKD